MTSEPLSIRALRLGTRNSPLAMKQAELIAKLIKNVSPHTEIAIVPIQTTGDALSQVPIVELAEKEEGIFNKALEMALLEKKVDISTASFKDIESTTLEGIACSSIGARCNPSDVLITRHQCEFAQLPHGAKLATSSPRRIGQLKAARQDLDFTPLRGNVTTRIERYAPQYDGIILAAAGVLRVGLGDKIAQYLPTDLLVPAPAQGVLGCQYLSQRQDIKELLLKVYDPKVETCTWLEKRLLTDLTGGCFAPIGILAELMEEEQVQLICRVADIEGKRVVQAKECASLSEVDLLRDRVKNQIIQQGGLEIIEQSRIHYQNNSKL